MEVAVVAEIESKVLHEHNFQDLFKQYYPYVVRRALPIVQDANKAEDIAQDVFMKLFNTDWRAIDNIPAWLNKVVFRIALNDKRSINRRFRREEHYQISTEICQPSTEKTWFSTAEVEVVQQVLAEMEEREQVLLIMKYSGHSYQELAEATGIDSASVGTLLARAKKKFRTMYEQMRGDE